VADEKRSEDVPHNRITRLANVALDAVQRDEGYDGEKVIVFLDGQDMGGIGMSGYDDDTEAMVNLFMHLRAIFAANGKELSLFPIKQAGRG